MDFMEMVNTEARLRGLRNNVNDNGVLNRTNNDNDIDRSKKIDLIAQRLVDTYNSPESWKFYCKVAMKLSEAQIWNNVEQSKAGRSPAGLFNHLCRKLMS